MLRAERQAKILQIVRDRGFIENDELMALFKTSHVTIRRDLVNLAEQGLIKLEHGGATSINYLEGMPEPLYETKLYFRAEEKKAIVTQAMTMIKDGDILFLGDEFGQVGGFIGSDSLMMRPESVKGGLFVSVGKEPNGVPEGVLHYRRGPKGFLEILDIIASGRGLARPRQ